MLSKKFKELADQKAKVARLERAVAAERESTLRQLHAELGFDSTEDLIAALRGVTRGGKKRGRPPGTAAGDG